jgi:transposase
MSTKDTAEKAVRDIRRKTSKQYLAKEKIRTVLSGLRGGESIAVRSKIASKPRADV